MGDSRTDLYCDQLMGKFKETHGGMRKRDYMQLRLYCRDMADTLELRDWTITVVVADPGGPQNDDGTGWGASSRSLPGRKNVTVTFDPWCRHWSLDELRATVIHELLHAHFASIAEMVRVDLHGHMGQAAYVLFDAGLTRHLEYGIDAVADALAKHLPHIKWPE